MDSTIGTVLTETDTTTGPRPHVYSVLDHTPQILNDNGFMQRCNVLCRTPRDARAVITDVESSSSLVPRFRFCNETLHALDERKVLPSLHSRDSVELCRLAAGKRCLAQRWLASRILLTHVIVRQSLFFFRTGLHCVYICFTFTRSGCVPTTGHVGQVPTPQLVFASRRQRLATISSPVSDLGVKKTGSSNSSS